MTRIRYTGISSLVSIPFKRESVFKDLVVFISVRELGLVSIPFKRESVFKGQASEALKERHTSVSIPFKRESVFKAQNAAIFHTAPSFQFPSNGKVYSKRRHPRSPSPIKRVSIPFKRESVFKEEISEGLWRMLLFQFPSNGKVYSKFWCWELFRQCLLLSFNSLQTGKCIQSLAVYFIRKGGARNLFQFPSNGKVYSKSVRPAPELQEGQSFNSLQTGKCIQRDSA